MPHRTHRLERFDMALPPAAVETIKREADIRCIHARTMGRILMVEKIKEITGIAPDQSLPTEIDAIPGATREEGATHGSRD